MNHLHDFDSSPPPPAYSEQEFDQKVSLASQLSIRAHQDHAQREDEWEVWDDAQFEVAAARLQNLSLQGDGTAQESKGAGPSSNRSSMSGANTGIQPLRIHKKNPSTGRATTPPGKQKPSWLAEAEANTSGASSSRALPPLAAPAYTSSAQSSGPSSAALSPTSALTNPYGDSQWGPISPVPSLPDPRVEQEEHPPAHSDVPPALTDESLPPPPFSPEGPEGQLLHPHSTDASTQPSPTLSATLIPGPGSHEGSSPAYSPHPDTNLHFEVPAATVQQPQQISMSNPQPGVALYSTPPQPLRHGIPPSLQPVPQRNPPSQLVPAPNRPDLSYTSLHRNTAFPTPSHAPPQIKVDMSTVYGKRAIPTTQVHETRATQVFNAAAFYNSAVSAHLGSTNLKPPVNGPEPKRLSHQPPSSTSLYNFPQAAQSTPGRYNYPQVDHHPSYNPRPYNPSFQDPLIRSPTPTYPVGHSSNPMPQMLAAANETYYNQTQQHPYSRGSGAVTWTESYNPYC